MKQGSGEGIRKQWRGFFLCKRGRKGRKEGGEHKNTSLENLVPPPRPAVFEVFVSAVAFFSRTRQVPLFVFVLLLLSSVDRALPAPK